MKNRSTVQRKIKEIFLAKIQEDPRCRFCECNLRNVLSDPCHLIRRTGDPLSIIEEWNIEPGCRDCHTIYDNYPSRWNELNQKNLAKILNTIKEHDGLFYNRLILNALERGWTNPLNLQTYE